MLQKMSPSNRKQILTFKDSMADTETNANTVYSYSTWVVAYNLCWFLKNTFSHSITTKKKVLIGFYAVSFIVCQLQMKLRMLSPIFFFFLGLSSKKSYIGYPLC